METVDYPGPVTAPLNRRESRRFWRSDRPKPVEQNVVKSQGAFLQAWNDNAAANSLQPGTYTLMQEMRAVDALAALLDPANRSSNAITVPPGFTKAQVAERLTDFGDFSADEVEAAMNDAEALGLPDYANGDVEGWLAPGSYEIHSDDQPVDVLKRMVDGMKAQLDDLGVPDADREPADQGLHPGARGQHRAVLPEVARVIENRPLSRRGDGQFEHDQRSLRRWKGWRRSIPRSSMTLNKYNTYKHKGLLGPISSPSEQALKATQNPEEETGCTVTINLIQAKRSSPPEEQERTIESTSAKTTRVSVRCVAL